MKNLHGYLKIILLALLPAVLWLFINATVNRHVHTISEDNIISHSHPYDKSAAGHGPVSSHQHSKSDYLLLQLISLTGTVELIIFSICFSLYFSAGYLKANIRQTRPVKEFFGILSYRGPPDSLSSPR